MSPCVAPPHGELPNCAAREPMHPQGALWGGLLVAPPGGRAEQAQPANVRASGAGEGGWPCRPNLSPQAQRVLMGAQGPGPQRDSWENHSSAAAPTPCHPQGAAVLGVSWELAAQRTGPPHRATERRPQRSGLRMGALQKAGSEITVLPRAGGPSPCRTWFKFSLSGPGPGEHGLVGLGGPGMSV